VEKVKLDLPSGVRITPAPDKSLAQMLSSGELDAVISAREPGGVRLFKNSREMEEAYFKKTGIYPIMHVIVLRRESYERDRWIAMNLFGAFEEAKRASMERILEIGLSHVPMPWLAEHARRWRSIAGEDFWPYGIDANRTTLEAFLQYSFEQGITPRKLEVEQLFAPETRERFKI
jgi:4,5-dihydroxyphthalate decarboxylase